MDALVVRTALEERLGAPRFILFYLACGLVAGLTHFAFNLESGVPVIGASGAIAGVLGAYTLVHPTARIAILTPILFFPMVFHLPAVVYTGLWFVFQVARGIAEFSLPGAAGGIAWWAHIGGLVAGLALIGAIGRQRTRVREIGAPRPRTIAFGDRARRLAAAAVPSGPRPKPEATGTPPSEEAGRVGLVRRLARKGRSVIPRSSS